MWTALTTNSLRILRSDEEIKHQIIIKRPVLFLFLLRAFFLCGILQSSAQIAFHLIINRNRKLLRNQRILQKHLLARLRGDGTIARRPVEIRLAQHFFFLAFLVVVRMRLVLQLRLLQLRRVQPRAERRWIRSALVTVLLVLTQNRVCEDLRGVGHLGASKANKGGEDANSEEMTA